jgi:hypothetical protein
MAPLPEWVVAFVKFPWPATVEQLPASLGLFNFYRRFVQAVAKTLWLLTEPWEAALKVVHH